MATQETLIKIVRAEIESGRICPDSPESHVREAYNWLCANRRMPMPSGEYDMDGNIIWQPRNQARLWGNGPNESYEAFLQTVTGIFWGENDNPPQNWPAQFPGDERLYAANIFGCHPGSLSDAIWMDDHPDADILWERFRMLIRNRTGNSPYYFANLPLFVRAVRQRGTEWVMKYNHAATWSALLEIQTAFGLESVSDMMAVHRAKICVGNHEEQHEWKALFDTYDARRVVGMFEALTVDGRTPSAWSVRAAFNGGKPVANAPWMRQIAPHMKGDWANFTPGQLRSIRDESWGFVTVAHIRERLLRGETPASTTGNYLTNREATEWLHATGGEGYYDYWYATERAGLTPEEYYKLAGYSRHADRRVVEWYARKKNTRGMTQEREWRLPDATLVRIPLTAVLDEVRDEHLVNGVNTDPSTVFAGVLNSSERAQWRAVRDAGELNRNAVYSAQEERRRLEEKKRLAAPFPVWEEREKIEGVTQVATAGELIAIGNSEGHCAGMYAEACANGEVFMFRVNLNGRFSLFQINAYGSLVQHYARGNTVPPESHRAAVENWLHYNSKR